MLINPFGMGAPSALMEGTKYSIRFRESAQSLLKRVS